jgi:hypothetical protein
MLARAPGFAPVWQAVLVEVEKELQKANKGMAAFVKRFFRPSRQLGTLYPESIKLLNRNGESGL